jgi:hypothetical protein
MSPETVIAAVVVIATGLALVAGEPRLFATNSMFQLKIAAVVLWVVVIGSSVLGPYAL